MEGAVVYFGGVEKDIFLKWGRNMFLEAEVGTYVTSFFFVGDNRC